jgi:hypothetical protein
MADGYQSSESGAPLNAWKNFTGVADAKIAVEACRAYEALIVTGTADFQFAAQLSTAAWIATFSFSGTLV